MPPQYALSVFPADAFRVVSGLNIGESIADIADIALGDGYQLSRNAKAVFLDLETLPGNSDPKTYKVQNGSAVEAEGIRARPTARITFLSATGTLLEAVLIACDAPVSRHYLYPLGPIGLGAEYQCIAVDTTCSDLPVADKSGLGIARGTRVTMSDGNQRPVEALAIGDRVLTRDHGMQPIRWIGTRTVQAVGPYAPVIFAPGSLGNVETITVGQHHRMLISDWRAEIMTGSRDVLIFAKDLVNDETIYPREGGFVDYVQPVFDQHQIIYVEGVPTESLRISHDTLVSLPQDSLEELKRVFPDLPSIEQSYSRTPLESALAQNLLRQTGRF